MYFSYLRGRQYELLALKELAQKNLINGHVIPVVEPIKKSTTFDNTIRAFQQANLPIAVIFNPAVGELGGTDSKVILPSSLKNIIPSIIVQNDAEDSIKSILNRGVEKKNFLAILNERDNLNLYSELFDAEKPKYTLFPEERAIRRTVSSGKIIFEDKFIKQDKNADYLRNEDEFFSDDHLYYKEEGYSGFGDYSIIGNHFDEKGFAPLAVVIHIVYFSDDETLRIHHFVSDSNDGIEDVAGKFYEAVQKLYKWYALQNDKRLNTNAMSTLLEYAEKGYYPGLPTIKKLSIMHHLELMDKFLEGANKA